MEQVAVNPTLTWEERQRDIAQRIHPQEIADFICNTAPWAQSQQFFRQLRDAAGLRREHHLLDAGCASGQLGFAAAVYGGCHVTLMDYSQEALRFAQAVERELRKRGKQLKVAFMQDNLESLSIVDEFDIVANEGVLEHWLSWEERLHVLNQMVKITKPGGTVVIWVPNVHNSLYQQWIKTNIEVPERAFSMEELRKLFISVGLEAVRVLPVTAYKSFVHYTSLSNVKWLAGILWLMESALPERVLRPYLVRFGYELVGMGSKPVKIGL